MLLDSLPSRRKRCPTCGQLIGGGMKPGLPEEQLKPTPFPGQKERPEQSIWGDRPPPNSSFRYTQVMPPPGTKYVYNQQTGQRNTVPIAGGKWQNPFRKLLPTPGIDRGQIHESERVLNNPDYPGFRPIPHIKPKPKPISRWRKV